MNVAWKEKNFEDNQRTIDKALNNYLDAGFQILSSVSGGNQFILITTYILEKD